ncbi:uncharacterized protein LOC136074597 [Hydra vulgaris]|uniref:Uncharacterized protein LOC136074597 n=1 Tax=Hydra vulgaris TaxID=6087 RepID=A0ABM4B2J3_HYDVU
MALNNILKEENLLKTFSLCTFNCQGLKTNIKFTETLIISHDFTFLCEHWVSKLEYPIIKNICKNSHSLYFSQANKHEQGRPFGGNASFIRKHQFQNIISIYEDDNIFAIKLQHGIINSHKGNDKVIILGDFQSFPNGIYDLLERTSSKRNNYSLILSEFIESNELELVDVTKGSGPVITYRHLTLPNSSYIDHIEDISIPRYLWNNLDFINLYKDHLNTSYNNLNLIGNFENELDQIYTTITNSGAWALREHLKSKKRSDYSKSWWTPELTRSKKILSHYFQKWRETGFVKDSTSSIFNRYLFARKNFRKAVKAAQNNKLYYQYIKIEKLKNNNPKNFWNDFKSITKNSNPKLFAINNKKDKESITAEFATIFEKRLNTERLNHSSIYRQVPPCENPNEIAITDENIKVAISCLKLNKCHDHFNISAEHLKYAQCDTLTQWIRKFFHFSINHGWTPTSMSTSTIIPLVKSYKKSLTDPNNYRGISIIPIFTKLLEYLILLISPEIKETHPLQFGFNSKSLTLHAEFVISETIKHYNNNNSPIYLCSLDAEKAFDSCNWDILFDKLYFDKNLPLQIVNTISSLYNKSSATVSYLGFKSVLFALKQGVRQGSILSPYLYNIYTEKLLETIKNDNFVGTTIHGNFTGVVAYADDIILLSSTLSGLERLITMCNIYNNLNGIKLNAVKTELLLSRKRQLTNCKITLDDHQIIPNKKLNHVGFIWDTQKSIFASLNRTNINNRVSNFQTIVQTLIQSGIRFVHPSSIIQLYALLAVPNLTHGLELCENRESTTQRLNKLGRNAVKSFFNISKYSKNYINSLFKVQEISTYIQQNKINLFIRLLNNKITFKIINSQLNYCSLKYSFLVDIKELCKIHKINMKNLIQDRKKVKIIISENIIPEDTYQILVQAIQCRNAKQQRTIFKNTLEENIPK